MDSHIKLKFAQRFTAALSACALLTFCAASLAQDSDQPPAIPSEELPAGSQVLAQGPVHEAFAKPVAMEAEEPILVPQQPPANLQEVPPSEQPAGAGIVWVPGYWAWDQDRNDFIWVSGCWRNAPPNTYWVPGHWLQAGNGWEWITGFWKPIASQTQQEIEYLPAPPAPTDVDPPGAPPQPDMVWVPGCWYWDQGHYIPRNGYWITQQVGWVWVPSHFAWTPHGYIFVQGHWDHDMDNRGVLFCPAFFPRPVRTLAGFVFSPGACVDLGMLRLNLFVYPRYRHYYFGDYYDNSYTRIGIFPWFKCETIHTWYDPLYVYDRWHFQKTDPHWAANLVRGFDDRQSHRDLRPAHTITELQAQISRLPANRRPERPLAESIKTYAVSQHTTVKFQRLNDTDRRQIAAKATDVHALRTQRAQWEAPKASAPRPASPAKPEPTPRKQEPAPKPAKITHTPAFVPAREVHVTQPERVSVPTTPRTPQPAQSHFIAKQPPSHPAQEMPHASAAPAPRRK
jgi:hypothetical protein